MDRSLLPHLIYATNLVADVLPSFFVLTRINAHDNRFLASLLPHEGVAKIGWGHAPPFRSETCTNLRSFALKVYLLIFTASFYNTLLDERG
jgi:hypothetical protein